MKLFSENKRVRVLKPIERGRMPVVRLVKKVRAIRYWVREALDDLRLRFPLTPEYDAAFLGAFIPQVASR
jgi:hypothetical protein